MGHIPGILAYSIWLYTKRASRVSTVYTVYGVEYTSRVLIEYIVEGSSRDPGKVL